MARSRPSTVPPSRTTVEPVPNRPRIRQRYAPPPRPRARVRDSVAPHRPAATVVPGIGRRPRGPVVGAMEPHFLIDGSPYLTAVHAPRDRVSEAPPHPPPSRAAASPPRAGRPPSRTSFAGGDTLKASPP